MTPAEGSNFLTKFVEAIKDLPAWLFTALAVAAGLCMLDGIESKELHSFPSVHGSHPNYIAIDAAGFKTTFSAYSSNFAVHG